MPIPQKAATRFPRSVFQSRALAGGRNQPVRGVDALELRRPRGSVAAHGLPDLGPSRTINQVRPRKNHQVGPPQPAGRLSQQPAGKHVIEPERLQGVEQDNIEVPGEAAVLKAVVEHNQLAAEPCDGLAGTDRRSGFSTCGVSGSRRCNSRASSFSRPDGAPRTRG